ncbi:MAG: hypothetical protein HYZ17_16475 [Betaproteobacteria bacterium]|nr:hypothetical protein [Betaproteobacteria bacterium]
MKRALVFAAVLAAGLAMAEDRVAREGNDYVRIRTSPCSSAQVLALLPEEMHDQFQDAVSQVDGKTFRGCWMLLPDGRVFLKYEDNDIGVLRYGLFKPGV